MPIIRVILILIPLAVITETTLILVTTRLLKQRDTERCGPEVVITPSISQLGNFTQWAVSTDALQCTSISRKIFLMGGTTADAAVATLLCMGVVNPHTSGIGGGFFATMYNSVTKTAYTVNARERAPIAANMDMFVSNKELSSVGGLSVAIPGEVRGLQQLLRVMGTKLPWHTLFFEAVQLARYGFIVGNNLAYRLQTSKDAIYRNANLRNIFWNKETNDSYHEGELLVQADLASTLEVIGKNGADSFYQGELAEQMAQEIRENGGIITPEDLSSYKALAEDAVNTRFNDGRVLYSVTPPGGGAVVAYIMGVMDSYRSSPDDTLADNTLTLHRFIETCKFASASRGHLGDKAYVNVDQIVRNLTSADYFAATREVIDDSRTFDDWRHYDSGSTTFVPDHGTAHASFWGPDGQVIAVTTSLNNYFGSHVRTSAGVLLNNQMDDFATPGEANLWGVAPSEANFVVPGKRPMSSMAPIVIVDEKGEVEVVLGGSGGSKITSGVALVTCGQITAGFMLG